MLLLISLLLGGKAGIVFAGSSLADWQGHFAWGSRAECAPGEMLVGSCTSGANRDCNLNGIAFSHLTRCATIVSGEFPWHDNELEEWHSTQDWFDYVECSPGYFAVGRCSSGENKDCPNGATHELRCAKAPTPRVVLDYTDTETYCTKYGVLTQCSAGYVITKSCGGGENNNDCRTDICSSGNDVWQGIQCTRVRGYEYDSVSEVSEGGPPEYSIQGCSKQFYSNGGSTPITRTGE